MASTACLKSVSTQLALKSLDLSSSKNGLSGNAVAAPVARSIAVRKHTVCRAEAQADVPAVSRRAAVAAFVAGEPLLFTLATSVVLDCPLLKSSSL
jgi:hypothetical protein